MTDFGPVRPWAAWPNDKDRGQAIDIYVKMYRGEGFVKADTGKVQAGFDKIVLYWDAASGAFTHVARLMDNGQWMSKLGTLSDVEHVKPDTLGPAGQTGYGVVWGYMKRAKGKAGDSTPLKKKIEQ